MQSHCRLYFFLGSSSSQTNSGYPEFLHKGRGLPILRSARRLRLITMARSRSVDVLGAVGLKRFVQMHESSCYGLKLEQVRVGRAITYLAQKSGATSAFHVRRDKALWRTLTDANGHYQVAGLTEIT